jgi:ATP-dependent Lhr-like helicase
VHPAEHLVGPPGVLTALERLQGEDFPLRVWEQALLPARVERYQREWLDQVGLSGEIVWTVFDPPEGEPARPGRLGVALRENVGWLRGSREAGGELAPRAKNVLRQLEVRGASFVQDLARAVSLSSAETLEALWELFQAGLVTPDSFSAVAAAAAPPRGAGAPGSARRRRRGAFRGFQASVPAVGRWSALGDEDGLSPEERDEARAQLLLARYGVLARELARGDWSRLRHTLLRMEYGGAVVRGYFVEGLSGEQYALADALPALEARASRAEAHVLVSMVDPANLWGSIFTLARPDGVRLTAPRIPQAWLVCRAGRPIVHVEGHGRALTPLAGWERVDLPGVVRALQSLMDRPLPFRPVRRLEILTWNGHPVRQTDAFEALVAAGFTADGSRLTWDGHPGPR